MISSCSGNNSCAFERVLRACVGHVAFILMTLLGLLSYGTTQAQMASARVFDASGQLHSDPGREQMAEVIARGQEELGHILQQTLKEVVWKVQTQRAEVESFGIKPGMRFEMDLGLGVSVSIDVEHLPKLLN